jgi:rhodanese-related sulfurtransferase
MPVKRVLPKEAAALLTEGYKYLDVRSVLEFEAGHPTGAYNIPLADMVPGRGMAPNPAFFEQVAKHFAKDAKIVCGCQSGGRSLRAAEALISMGYTGMVELATGYGGSGAGPGWKDSGLPVATKAEPGKSFAELK